MKQIFHQYIYWEDYKSGVWRMVDKETEGKLLSQCIQFTGNHALYGMAMTRVIYEWPLTCEHHLSNLGLNRKAWIGHAACQLDFGCPEYITRMAWGHLSKEQQIEANNVADLTIKLWEKMHSHLLENIPQEENSLNLQKEITQQSEQPRIVPASTLNLFM